MAWRVKKSHYQKPQEEYSTSSSSPFGYLSLFIRPVESIRTKEPHSLPGSQACGGVQEPAPLRSWSHSYGCHRMRESASRTMIGRLKLEIPAVKAGLQVRVRNQLGSLQGRASHNTRANSRTAPQRADCQHRANSEREPGVLTAAHAPGRSSSTSHLSSGGRSRPLSPTIGSRVALDR